MTDLPLRPHDLLRQIAATRLGKSYLQFNSVCSREKQQATRTAELGR